MPWPAQQSKLKKKKCDIAAEEGSNRAPDLRNPIDRTEEENWRTYSMALIGRKSRNWTNKEDEKLLDGIDRDGTQIRNHYNDTVKKLKAWEWLIGQTGVGVNPIIGVVTVTDYTWEKFLKRVPPNLDKIKAVVHGRHATSDLSFSPVMGASGSRHRPVQQNLAVDLEEHVGDSDEAKDDEYNEQTEVSAGAESRSPPRTIQTNARKRRSEGGSSGDRRRMRQELDAEVHNALALMRLKAESRLNPPPSTYEKVLTKLREHPGVAAKGPYFIFNVMEYIRREQDFDYFVVFNDDDITRYIQVRGLGDVMDEEEDCVVDTLILHTLVRSCSQQRTASYLRLPRMIGEESGGAFIHRVLNSTREDFCRRAIDERRFIKIAEIVALSLYIFARGASYRDVEIRFRHSPSTVSTYHNQVLETLVKLSADIARPYRSPDEVSPELA
ncbi:hypothetical protein Cgig2_029442 [Carnegiea gigantea]|uniref:DUF8040 domain-containing protein n=1 Tax=Carnegiea gigantea TaxID=171969 RepID=A0A9Q1JY64_9CARY|nr:hypothetical protein Cgig2_029442 [Carnegiea gigantea]